MHDRVADVLSQRAALDRGPAAAIALSVLLHGALGGLLAYSALHATAPQPATFVSIQFAPMAPSAPAAAKRASRVEAPKPAAPEVEKPKPQRIEPPKPVVEDAKPVAKPEKNTVPLSPFGRSEKKGSANAPVPTTPAPAPSPSLPVGIGTSTADVPVGGTGVTGLEGGDFPYAIYIQSMNRKISAAWARPQVTPGTAAIIYFRIQRDGKILDAKIETPSGNPTFDRTAMSAVLSASPLNPLPFGYSGPFLGVRLTFK
jgi:TonB family protein